MTKRLSFPRRRVSGLAFICGLLLASSLHAAEIQAKNAWVRGTVPAQTSTGAFLTITSSEDARLLSIASPIARTVEIHNTENHGGVVHMGAVDSLALPAGKAVELKPGGHHVMLMGLTRPVKAGDKVPLKITVEDRKGKRQTVDVSAEVRPLGQ